MARGLPALWSALVSLPFFVAAGLLYTNESVHPLGFAPFLGFGAFVLIVGIYVHVVAAPTPPRTRDGERVMDSRHPSQRVPLVRVLAGTPFLGAGAVLLFGTRMPYVYPTLALAAGLWLFSTGIHQYWVNSLTTYVITTERLVRVYRFLSLVQSDIPFEKVRVVEERRSLIENLVGLGNVRAASGAGGLSITVRHIGDPEGFAHRIREFL